MHTFLKRIYPNFNKVAAAATEQKPRDWSEERKKYDKSIEDINNNTKDITYINTAGMDLSPETRARLLEEQKGINRDRLEKDTVNSHLQDIKPEDPNLWWDRQTKTVLYNDPVTGKAYTLTNEQLRHLPWYQQPEAYKIRNAPEMPKHKAEQLAYNERIDAWLGDNNSNNTQTKPVVNNTTNTQTNNSNNSNNTQTKPAIDNNLEQKDKETHSYKNPWGLTQEQQEELNNRIRSQGAIINPKDIPTNGIPANMEETNVGPFTSGLRFKDMGQFSDIQKQQVDYQQKWRRDEAYKNLEKYNKQFDKQVNELKKSLNNPSLSPIDRQKIQNNIKDIEKKKQLLKQRFNMQLAYKQ